jgi:hypothetical protein
VHVLAAIGVEKILPDGFSENLFTADHMRLRRTTEYGNGNAGLVVLAPPSGAGAPFS